MKKVKFIDSHEGTSSPRHGVDTRQYYLQTPFQGNNIRGFGLLVGYKRLGFTSISSARAIIYGFNLQMLWDGSCFFASTELICGGVPLSFLLGDNCTHFLANCSWFASIPTRSLPWNKGITLVTRHSQRDGSVWCQQIKASEEGDGLASATLLLYSTTQKREWRKRHPRHYSLSTLSSHKTRQQKRHPRISHTRTQTMATCQHDFEAYKHTRMEWDSSLIKLLRIGRASGAKATSCGFKGENAMNETISTICLIEDNAKAHRSLSDSSITTATTPSSSLMNDSNDYRALLESLLFEDDGCDDDDDWAHHFQNSHPAPRRKKGSHSSRGTDHFSRWGSSSDPELGRLTLDDMLREDEVSRRNVPRPVRQQSLEGPPFERILAEHHDIKDHCPTLVRRQRTLSFDGL
mmetsp:Transcript_255/g.518  ORF Transcript_255/g.518 Transcript_255/m.518 type:complete len:405 (+) Transcript_255:1348-2562(+)